MQAAVARSTIIAAVQIRATPSRISLPGLSALIFAIAALIAGNVVAADAPSSPAGDTTDATYSVVIDAPLQLVWRVLKRTRPNLFVAAPKAF